MAFWVVKERFTLRNMGDVILGGNIRKAMHDDGSRSWVPSGKQTWLWKMAIYSGFTH
jgi:hypothetical protein